RRDVLPRGAIVRRKPDVAVVGARVQQAGLEVRFGERRDGAVRFGAGGVVGDAARRLGADANLDGILRREVGRDRVDVIAAIRRLEYAVAADVERARGVRRDEERRVPIVAEIEVDRIRLLLRAELGDALLHGRRFRLRGVAAHGEDRVFPREMRFAPRRLVEERALTGAVVEAADGAALRFGVDDVRV